MFESIESNCTLSFIYLVRQNEMPHMHSSLPKKIMFERFADSRVIEYLLEFFHKSSVSRPIFSLPPSELFIKIVREDGFI